MPQSNSTSLFAAEFRRLRAESRALIADSRSSVAAYKVASERMRVTVRLLEVQLDEARARARLICTAVAEAQQLKEPAGA